MSEAEWLFDDFQIGQELPPASYQVTPEAVAEYLAVVQDQNPLYYDSPLARASEFGGPIAPPSMATVYASLRPGLREKAFPPGTVMVMMYFKFFAPVRRGDTLALRTWVAEKYQRRSSKYLTFAVSAQNQRGEMVAESRRTLIWPK